MTLESNELYTSSTTADRIRMQPHADGVSVVTVVGVSGAPLYPQGMPMGIVLDSGLWGPFTQGDSTGLQNISGFIWDHEGVQLHGTNEVQANVM